MWTHHDEIDAQEVTNLTNVKMMMMKTCNTMEKTQQWHDENDVTVVVLLMAMMNNKVMTAQLYCRYSHWVM